MATQYKYMNTYQTQSAIPEQIQAKQVTWVLHQFGISKHIEEHGNFRGQLKKKWSFHSSVHKKVMWND